MNFADYKRFLEWYMGDDEFRERFDRAPAAALYGSQAANGVILVTT